MITKVVDSELDAMAWRARWGPGALVHQAVAALTGLSGPAATAAANKVNPARRPNLTGQPP